MSAYDVGALRANFPALVGTGPALAHFDGPGGSLTPTAVAQAVATTMTAGLSNRGAALTRSEQAADRVVTEARLAVADLVAGDPRGVVLGRSMTSLTLELSRALATTWRPGDEVVVTRLDHDANVRPWVLAAQAAGAEVRWVDFDPGTGELEVEQLCASMGERTRLVALTGASNLIGTRPDVARVSEAAHEVGALVFVDAVHLAAHHLLDVTTLGADFLALSPYKLLGPHCGVLHAAPSLLEQVHPAKLEASTEAVPERFELGTLPYELMAGVTAMVDFLADLAPGAEPGARTRRERLAAGFAAIETHEHRLRQRVEEGLLALGLTVHSRAARRTPTLLATFEEVPGVEPLDAYRYLATRDVCAPAGSFYAVHASRHLGLGDAGGLRVGISPYTDDDDVDRLLGGLGELLSGPS